MTADIDAVLSRLRERPECRDAVEVIEELRRRKATDDGAYEHVVGLYHAADEALRVAERDLAAVTAERDRLRNLVAGEMSWLIGWAGYVSLFEKDGAFERILAIGDAVQAALGESPVPDEPTGRARRVPGESLSFEVVAVRGDRTALWNDSHGFGEWWPTADLVSVAPSTPPCECWEHNASPSHPTGEERDR